MNALSAYAIDWDLFAPLSRKAGISGFMRVRDEAEFVALSIESFIPYLDELVVVHNRCVDRSEEILNDCQRKYPSKIKVFHYEPYVYPPGSKGHAARSGDDINSLVNYYNFSLSKTTRRTAVKIDADEWALPAFGALADTLREQGAGDKCFYFKGINFIKRDAGFFVRGTQPLTGGLDSCFFNVGPRTRFVWHPYFEVFDHAALELKDGGILFLHLKCMKKDYGFSNYDLNENPQSRYKGQLDSLLLEPVLPWSDFQSAHPQLLSVVLPDFLKSSY